MVVINSIAEFADDMTAWRRHLHQNPELGVDCHETADFVVARLREFGIGEIHTGFATTGLVALIDGQGPGPTIGLRADMDALPIAEASGVDWASTRPGKMHACGHDGHTAMLLGAAQYLAETRNFDGTAVMIFQPAEEGGGGGLEMCKDGLMERWGIQEVYGMHNMPDFPVGEFAIRSGALLAAADEFFLTITGRGGHAAAPHEAIDPNVAAAHVILALQSVASRVVDPLGQVVVSVCGLHSDTEAHNVIPQVVWMRGTVRTLDPAVRDMVEMKVKQLVSMTAQAHDCIAEVNYERGYPVTVNTAANTDYAADAALAVAGSVDTNTPPIMAAEDFSYMLEERPGAYIMIGNGDGATVHHPEYNFNDNAIPAGCSWYAEMVERRMPV